MTFKSYSYARQLKRTFDDTRGSRRHHHDSIPNLNVARLESSGNANAASRRFEHVSNNLSVRPVDLANWRTKAIWKYIRDYKKPASNQPHRINFFAPLSTEASLLQCGSQSEDHNYDSNYTITKNVEKGYCSLNVQRLTHKGGVKGGSMTIVWRICGSQSVYVLLQSIFSAYN